jgi:twitching motility two-component system response regulator PilG
VVGRYPSQCPPGTQSGPPQGSPGGFEKSVFPAVSGAYGLNMETVLETGLAAKTRPAGGSRHNKNHATPAQALPFFPWIENQGCHPMSNFEGLKVMVIDDSKTIRRTAETLLQKAGCEVITATDGFDALAKIADTNPDIIFVDIMMPRLDGYQTCALIKNNSNFKSTPVIMLSSKDGLFDKAKGRIVGSDQYLTKPFSKDELLGAIEQHVKK